MIVIVIGCVHVCVDLEWSIRIHKLGMLGKETHKRKEKTKIMQIVSRVSKLPFANFLAAMFFFNIYSN